VAAVAHAVGLRPGKVQVAHALAPQQMVPYMVLQLVAVVAVQMLLPVVPLA